MSTRLIGLLLAVALAGCASSGTSETRPTQNWSVITAEEIRTAPQTDALNLVQTLRPQWLRTRGPTTLRAGGENPVQVYVDGTRLGGPEQLRAITVAALESLRFLDAREASARFGFDHVNGAIVVNTKRGGPIPPGSR